MSEEIHMENGKEDKNEEHEEYQYLQLVEKIIKTGVKRSNRTGIDTYSIFGTQIRFSLRNGKYIYIDNMLYTF